MSKTFFIDPDEELDFTWDFAPWLDGDLIDQADVVPHGVELLDHSHSDTAVTAWIKGPTGSSSSLVCSITTSGGRKTDRTIHLTTRQR